jgi:hypothetical protein
MLMWVRAAYRDKYETVIFFYFLHYYTSQIENNDASFIVTPDVTKNFIELRGQKHQKEFTGLRGSNDKGLE